MSEGFDKDAFLEWLESEEDGGYVADKNVREEWPEFFEKYDMIGVTKKMEDELILAPVIDYKDCIKYGRPID